MYQVMRKHVLTHANNKNTDQTARISVFVNRCLDSIPLVAISENKFYHDMFWMLFQVSENQKLVKGVTTFEIK